MNSKTNSSKKSPGPEVQNGNSQPEAAPKKSRAAAKKQEPEIAAQKEDSPSGILKTDSPAATQIISVNGRQLKVEELLSEYEGLLKKYQTLKKAERKAGKRYHQENQLRPYQAELIRMQKYLEEKQKRMIVVFEGRDAAGKGGTIRRLTRFMNEKHYRVVALGKPTEHERTQWFFQRYVTRFPRGGEIVLFDRSWYNRAMVEPVLGFCSKQEYEDFMHGVVGFEKDLVRQGTILIKLYFSVTREEQKRRFSRRKNDPLRQWKLSEVDMQAQNRWDDFTEMKYKMLKQTSTNESPWIIIRSDNKYKARLNAIKVILNAVPYERLNPKLDFVPDPEVVVSGARELEWMESQRIQSGKFLS